MLGRVNFLLTGKLSGKIVDFDPKPTIDLANLHSISEAYVGNSLSIVTGNYIAKTGKQFQTTWNQVSLPALR
jgi:hypothetical protein